VEVGWVLLLQLLLLRRQICLVPKTLLHCWALSKLNVLISSCQPLTAKIIDVLLFGLWRFVLLSLPDEPVIGSPDGRGYSCKFQMWKCGMVTCAGKAAADFDLPSPDHLAALLGFE
jgi:hypothetical protein